MPSGLKVSFLNGDMASRGDGRKGKVESVCILGSICATNLWCVLEQVTSHLSAYFQSVKQSIWVRQSVKSFPTLISNEVYDIDYPKSVLHTYSVGEKLTEVTFPLHWNCYELTKVCSFRVLSPWCGVVISQNPFINFCMPSPLISPEGRTSLLWRSLQSNWGVT